MEKYEVVLIICTFLPSLWSSYPTTPSNGCISDEKCVCYNTEPFLEYQCPPNNSTVDLKVYPFKLVEIDCNNRILDYNTSFFPVINSSSIRRFQFKYCPVPQQFDAVLKKLNYYNINVLEVEYPNTDNITLTKTHFKGLENLKKLEMYNFINLQLERDFLENLTKLELLLLAGNQLQTIDNVFENNPDIYFLDLSRNRLRFLNPGIFNKMPRLQTLHLWKNELTELNKGIFEGISDIRTLEMSSNKLEFISANTFESLVNLANISLSTNMLKNISFLLFSNNSKLENVKLRRNPLKEIVDYLFSNKMRLRTVDISFTDLESLPEHLFENSTNLVNLELSYNIKLKEIPENLFKGLTKLKSLSLARNGIEILNENTFSSLNELEILSLENNLLDKIGNRLFKNVQNLKQLNLNNNRITEISDRAFHFLTNLKMLNLAFNKFDFDFDDSSPFNNLKSIEILDLSHNLLTQIDYSLSPMATNFKKFNLSYNEIDFVQVLHLLKVSNYELEIDLSFNNITVVDLNGWEPIVNASLDARSYVGSSTILHITNNPIECNCKNYNLLRYYKDLQPNIKTLLRILPESPKCFEDNDLSLDQLHLWDLICPMKTVDLSYRGCPDGCACSYRPYDTSLVVDCSYRNLSEIPNFSIPAFTNQTEVNLEGNNLVEGPSEEFSEYDNVTNLFLNKNRIREIRWIPSKIKTLYLDGNNLTELDDDILKNLNTSQTLQQLTLAFNPWKCNCDTLKLQRFLQLNPKINSNDIFCKDTNELIYKKLDLCKSNKIIYISVVCSFLALCTIITAVIALYYRYEQEIKIWMYAKNLCLWFVTQEELDKDKIYDVFISYSHQDEQFVENELIQILESGPNPYKVCLHVRHFIPGEFIATQVMNAVNESRRTLVVLSNNFVNSEWGKLEFRTAHTQAIKEGLTRVIVVIYGELNEDKLDDDLKAYLKTNTYVKWGDPHFWNKLKYSLPHKQGAVKSRDQKRANMMIKIDEKFKIVKMQPDNNESTPPAVAIGRLMPQFT